MSIKHFENSVSNTRGNRKLSVAGVLATLADTTYTPVAAFPGQLAVRSALYPSQAYAGMNNPNTWYMVAANASTTLAELFVANPDVAQHADSANGIYNLGMETFGVAQPAGEATRFQKIEEGDLLTWGDGWFASAPTTTNKYCTINASGLWAPDDEVPSTAGTVYLEILETVNFTEGCYAAGTGYYGIIKVAA